MREVRRDDVRQRDQLGRQDVRYLGEALTYDIRNDLDSLTPSRIHTFTKLDFWVPVICGRHM